VCYEPSPRLGSVNGIPGACQLPGPGSLVDPAGIRGSPGPGILLRAERTPGAVAVSGVYGETGEGSYTPPGSPPTNSELPSLEGSLYIRQPGPLAGCPDPGGGSWPDGGSAVRIIP
jgi:hypothetical protein